MDKKIVSVVGMAALFACGTAIANASNIVANPTAIAKVQNVATCSGNSDTCTGNCCATCCGGCCGGCSGNCSGNCSGDENCSGNSGPAGSK